MIGFLRRLWRDRHGNALVIAGAALPLVIGSAGLASDTIQWVLWKRQLQRAADSAAIAGVYAKMQTTQTVDAAVTVDVNKNEFSTVATAFPKNPTLLNAPVITYPTIANTTNTVKVALSVQRSLAFSSLFVASAPVITAEATAATVQTGVYCVVSLENTGATGITATGHSELNLGCGMITNSTSLNAAIATGSSDVHASPIAAVGDIQDSDNWNDAELLPFTVAETDPFANVNVPSFTGCQGTTNQIKISNPGDTVDRTSDAAGSIQCVSGLDINGILKLGGATYIIDSGDVSFGSQAKVSCTGCTIVLTNSNSGTSGVQIGKVDINATAQVNMSAPDSGTFAHILFYQDRRASFSSSTVNKINGTSSSLMEGAFYFPNQILDINGTSDLQFTCAQFVARQVVFSGNGSINNTCTGGYDDPITGNHVRLVA